jgi:hypothetical protein
LAGQVREPMISYWIQVRVRPRRFCSQSVCCQWKSYGACRRDTAT